MNESQSYQNEEIQSQNDKIQNLRENNYVRGEKSGKWSEQQHMKYIAFIDHNREKMKSKQKRRSNKFYQQMSTFISTRNALQCRSHHQKLEQKYVNINKIIFLYKNTFDGERYNQTLDTIKKFYNQKHHFYKYHSQMNQQNNIEIQTDIGGLELQFIMINPNLIVIKTKNHFENIHQNSSIPLNHNNNYSNHYSQYSSSIMAQRQDIQPSLFIPNFL